MSEGMQASKVVHPDYEDESESMSESEATIDSVQEQSNGEEEPGNQEDTEVYTATLFATKVELLPSQEVQHQQPIPSQEVYHQPPLIPPQEVQQQQRAKKIQRTRRVKLNVAMASGINSLPAEGLKSKTVSKDSTQADQPEVDDEYEEDIASKILEGLLSAAKWVFRTIVILLKGFWRVFRKCLTIIRGCIPGAFVLALYGLVVYLLGTYVFEEVTAKDVPDFESRLRYLLRCQVWPVLPVLLAAVIGSLRKSETHRVFAREAFEQALLCLFNLLLFSTHIQHECLHWIWIVGFVSMIFSLLHWGCLVYGRRQKSVVSTPGMLVNFAGMVYNMGIIFGEDLGYIVHEPEAPMPQPGGTGGYWDYTTMCHLMERVFCAVDDSSSRAAFPRKH